MTHRLTLLLCGALACSRASSPATPTPTPAPQPTATTPSVPATLADAAPKAPVVPPALALLAGLMPLHSTGVDAFRHAHPNYDGRGVVIGILDSGIDPGTAGLIVTSTGAPKVLDLRDFSGEGRIALVPVTPDADGSVVVARHTLSGAGRIGRLAVATPWYAGVFRELPLGPPPAGDVNGNGTNTDVFPLVVVRASDGWVVFFDSNLNGSFEDEQPLHDYRAGRETIALGRRPVTLAANFSDDARGRPVLDLYFDTSGHGTHVAGIAAGHWLFGVAGFDGVAPGAQLLGLKIANDARGGISVTGSMKRAMDYAARFAAERGLPLVLNLSFGVGNEMEGHAAIDSVVDAFLVAHPAVVLTISAGNDGPGISTVGFPGSADLALSVGGLEPGAFTRAPQPGPPPPDRMAWWSSRGGDLGKPDVVAPGEAFSSVPRWNVGDEVKSGTSMAAPQMAGFVACLVSAMVQEGRHVAAADLTQAVRASATPLVGWTAVDQGAGVPSLPEAYRWLVAGHQGSRYEVRTAGGAPAALRRAGFAGAADTSQEFLVQHVDGYRAAQFLLTSDASWLSVPSVVTAEPRGTSITVHYHPALLRTPGLYVGSVQARNPTDTTAGSLFTLVSTVVVPTDLAARPFGDSARMIAPGRVQRYFLRSPHAGTSLHVSARVASPNQDGVLQLYDPDGRPASLDPDSLVVLGFGKDPAAHITVPAEEMAAGVYELDVSNAGTERLSVTVHARLAPVALGAQPGGVVEVSNPGPATSALTVRTALVGAEWRRAVAGRATAATTLTVAVPDWAVRGEVLVRMPGVEWNRFTDLGVTVFDSAGQQVHATPMNYARGRETFDVAADLAGHPVRVELFPALADPDSTASWDATVRVRFFEDPPTPAGPPQALDVVSGGRATLPAPPLPPLSLPDGFVPLLRRVLAPARDAAATAVGYQAVRP